VSVLGSEEPSGLFNGTADSVRDVLAWQNLIIGTVARRMAKTPEISLLSYNNGEILKAGVLLPGLVEIKTAGLPPYW